MISSGNSSNQQWYNWGKKQVWWPVKDLGMSERILVGSVFCQGLLSVGRYLVLMSEFYGCISVKSWWWWWLFPWVWGFWKNLTTHFLPPPFFFFSRGDQLAHTNSTLYIWFRPQWLSKLRWLWASLPWQVACEFVSLMRSHTMPEQLSQGKGCTHVQLLPATCTFGSMTRAF